MNICLSNGIRKKLDLTDPAHGIVTKTGHKTLLGRGVRGLGVWGSGRVEWALVFKDRTWQAFEFEGAM